jgi:hypothetical protein
MRGVTHPGELITTALELSALGFSDYEVARRLGVSRSTVWNWRRNGRPTGRHPYRPGLALSRPLNAAAYSYLGRYAYPRHFFTNSLADIRRIFCEHCELLGIRWSQSNSRNISVSHRDSVAVLDSFVGPKS